MADRPNIFGAVEGGEGCALPQLPPMPGWRHSHQDVRLPGPRLAQTLARLGRAPAGLATSRRLAALGALLSVVAACVALVVSRPPASPSDRPATQGRDRAAQSKRPVAPEPRRTGSPARSPAAAPAPNRTRSWRAPRERRARRRPLR